MNISYSELKRFGLIRQYNGKWQYRIQPDGKFYYADDKAGAIEYATEAYQRAVSKGNLLTPAERAAKAHADFIANFDLRYGKMSLDELQEMIDQARQVRGVSHEIEIRDGARSTWAATRNESARDAGEFILKMNLYLRERNRRERAASQVKDGAK